MDIESCNSSVGLNETDSVVIIRSPMCSDNEGCTTESGTSVDGSSRLGSDKFRLSGQFSSYDDSHISDTASEGEPLMRSSVLSNIKVLHRKKLVKRKPTKWSIKPFPNSSSSTDDVIIPMSKKTLTVSIPLHLVTLNTSKQLFTNNLLLRRDHFTVSRKRMLANSSGEDTNINNGRIRTSISLKLKKSASSNQWHPVTTIDTLPLTGDDLECVNDTTSPLDHRTDSTPLDNTTDSTPLDHTTDSTPLDNTTESISLDDTTDSTPLDHRTDSTPLVHTTDSMAEPISMVSSNSSTDDYYYLSDVSYSTSSTASDFIPCKMSKKNIQTNSNRKPFCFNDVFKSFIPELTISNGRLHPIQSLSVKGICIIPNNHPIKSWKLGRSVDRTTSKKRLKK